MFVTHLMMAAALVGGGGEGPVGSTASPVGSSQAARLVARDFGAGTTCIREGPTRSRHFFCELPELEGELKIRLSADEKSYELIPRTVHRTVGTESSAELHAARLVPSWDVAHVVCARRARRTFVCDGQFDEAGYRAGIEFGLSITKPGRFYIAPCRITWLGRAAGAIFACQHLDWDVNFPESEIESMEDGELG